MGGSVCKRTFSILRLKKVSLTPEEIPHIHTHSLPYFSSYHRLKLSYVSFVYLVTACLPLYENWNFLSQCGLYLSTSDYPFNLERAQNYYKRKEGRKEHRKKSVYI